MWWDNYSSCWNPSSCFPHFYKRKILNMHSFFILISNHFSSYLSRIFLSYYLSCFIKKKIVPLFILSTSPSFVSLHPYTPKIGYSNVFVLYKTKIQQNYFIVSLVCNFTRHQHWYTNHQDFSIPIASSQIQPKDTIK